MVPDAELNIWEHSATARELYIKRAHGLMEMDAAAQCAEILAPFIRGAPKPPRLLDAGCGTGYLFHSFKKRGLAVEYHGLDYSPGYIALAREILPAYGADPAHLACGRVEDLHGQAFDLVAMINTLTFCADFREPLDRLAGAGPAAMLIRDNFGESTERLWDVDGYLDEGHNHLKGYWNRWGFGEVAGFLAAYGYAAEPLVDRRARGRVEMVVDKPYRWSWLLARRA